MICHYKLTDGIKIEYFGKTMYINIEQQFKKSMIKDIENFISNQSKNRWFKTIVLKSWIMLDKNNNCRAFIKNICKRYNSECIIKDATFLDKIGTVSIKLLSCGNVRIPPYNKIGYCKIKVA